MAVVATRDDLLNPLFITKEEKYGVYQFKFFKDGKWRIVTIDDRLPITARTTKPFAYAYSQDINEVWVPLMEKAYVRHFQASSFVLKNLSLIFFLINNIRQNCTEVTRRLRREALPKH